MSTKVFFARICFITVRNIFLPLPSEFRSGPRSASAPANAEQIDKMTMMMIEVQRDDDDPEGDNDIDDGDDSD